MALPLHFMRSDLNEGGQTMTALPSLPSSVSERLVGRARRPLPGSKGELQRARDEVDRLTRLLLECESTLALTPSEVGAVPSLGDSTESNSFLERTRVAVARALVDGRPTIRAIGRALHASPRTVQRRLLQHGTTYVKLVDSVRRARVERLVTQGDLSITEIAFLAGFTDVGGFRRAFKRWTGVAPSEARVRQTKSSSE
jgi:AraC-like DNA-binding protein